MIQYKYIVRLAFIGLFINIIVNTIYYRYFMIEELVLNQVGAENIRIANTYTKNVWEKHRKAVSKLNNDYYIKLMQDSEFIQLAVASVNAFSNLNASISLYDLHGNKVMSNSLIRIASVVNYPDDRIYEKVATKIDKYFFKEYNVDRAFNNAFMGITSHVLIPRALLYESNTASRASFVTSYIPIIDLIHEGLPVNGVIEINTNISKLWASIINIERKVLGAFIVIVLIFGAVVIVNTNYAQDIIDKQFEINRNLEEAVIKVRNESSAHTQFFANVSHELRTPLNAIIGFSEIMLSEPYNKVHAGYIKDINQAGKHLLSIINDILDLSKASAEKLEIDFVELDLNKLITSTVRLMQPKADETKVQLTTNLPQEHIIITADPKRLKQVFFNLLSNAIKFTNQNGSVTIDMEKDEDKGLVYIHVIDTGIGIDEKDIPRVLSTFGQIDSELGRKYEGTGLGLPLTRKLVELMKGHFDLQSTLGVGTTITLTFPYGSSIAG